MIKLKRGQVIKAMLKTKISVGFIDYEKNEMVDITKGKETDYAIKTIFGNRDLQNDELTELPKFVHFSFLTPKFSELDNEIFMFQSEFKGTNTEASEFFKQRPNICSIKNLTKDFSYEKSKVF